MLAKLLEELFTRIKVWFEIDIPDRRLANDCPGRKWYTESVGWPGDLKMATLRKATIRDALNAEYRSRFDEQFPKPRKGISALKMEISQLYSFNKCWVQRHKVRVQYQRDDLSQKGVRNMYNVWQSFTIFKKFKEKLDT